MGERLYRIHVVSELVGISENLIRAWERRYAIVTPKRSPSGFRAYTDFDVEVLRRVKQHTKEGIAIGDVVGLLPNIRREVRAGRVVGESSAVAAPSSSQVERWLEAALSAAHLGHQGDVEAVLDEALAVLPPHLAAEKLMIPLQRAVGDLWHEGKLDVGQEHIVSHAVRVRFLRLIHGAPLGARRHVLCACFPEEQHDIGLLHAALRFRLAGFRVTYLGARAPVEDVVSLSLRAKPDMVALSAGPGIGKAALKSTLAQLVKALPKGIAVIVGGAGAEAEPEVVKASGAALIGEADWPRLLA